MVEGMVVLTAEMMVDYLADEMVEMMVLLKADWTVAM